CYVDTGIAHHWAPQLSCFCFSMSVHSLPPLNGGDGSGTPASECIRGRLLLRVRHQPRTRLRFSLRQIQFPCSLLTFCPLPTRPTYERANPHRDRKRHGTDDAHQQQGIHDARRLRLAAALRRVAALRETCFVLVTEAFAALRPRALSRALAARTSAASSGVRFS